MVEINMRDNELLVKFDYSVERVSKIKTIRPAYWNNKDKVWVVPNSLEMLEVLKKLFCSEQIEIIFKKCAFNEKLFLNTQIL
jgi:hypothetical protein